MYELDDPPPRSPKVPLLVNGEEADTGGGEEAPVTQAVGEWSVAQAATMAKAVEGRGG